jgi:5-formyltetrahydrofolate cyclo-ligase
LNDRAPHPVTTANAVHAAEDTAKEALRHEIWAALRRVARPDSRFHWDFAEFIADYEGSEQGAQLIRALPAWRNSRLMFITPDNNLEALRRLAIDDGKPFVMSTYGLVRGFLYLNPAIVAPEDHGWAATLDGMDRFATPIALGDIQRLGKIDLLATGASAISTKGIRSGKGHGYFDLEWAMFSEAGCLAEQPVVIAAGHDCQVVEIELPSSEFDTRVDLIVTPTRVLEVPVGSGHKPGRVVWERLKPDMEGCILPLRELRALQAERGNAT